MKELGPPPIVGGLGSHSSPPALVRIRNKTEGVESVIILAWFHSAAWANFAQPTTPPLQTPPDLKADDMSKYVKAKGYL